MDDFSAVTAAIATAMAPVSDAQLNLDGNLTMTLADGTEVPIVTGIPATEEDIDDIVNNLYKN